MTNPKLRNLLQVYKNQQDFIKKEIVNINDELSRRIVGGIINSACSNGTCNNGNCSSSNNPTNTTCNNDACNIRDMQNSTCHDTSCYSGS